MTNNCVIIPLYTVQFIEKNLKLPIKSHGSNAKLISQIWHFKRHSTHNYTCLGIIEYDYTEC